MDADGQSQLTEEAICFELGQEEEMQSQAAANLVEFSQHIEESTYIQYKDPAFEAQVEESTTEEPSKGRQRRRRGLATQQPDEVNDQAEVPLAQSQRQQAQLADLVSKTALDPARV